MYTQFAVNLRLWTVNELDVWLFCFFLFRICKTDAHDSYGEEGTFDFGFEFELNFELFISIFFRLKNFRIYPETFILVSSYFQQPLHASSWRRLKGTYGILFLC